MSKYIETTFSDVCTFENGDRGKNYPARSAYIDKGIPFFSAGNISNNKIDQDSLNYISKERFDILGSGKVRKGDVLFCLRGSLGKFAVIENDIEGGIASSLVIIRPSKKVTVRFFSFYLESQLCAEMIKLYDNGTAQPNLSASNLKKFKIPLPPLPEQKRIVAKLDGLFEKIDQAIVLLEENIEHTEALMGSVLDEIYSNGDTMLDEACNVGPKKSEVRDLDKDLEVSFLPMKDLNEHDINFIPKEIKKIGEVYKGYTYFAEGDVILAKVTPCFENGKAGLAKDLKNGIGFGSSEYHILRPKENVLPEWIYFAVLTEQFRVTGKENMTGAGGLKRISRDFVKDWKIPVPSPEIQKKQIERIVQIQEYTKSLEESVNKKLNHLKALKSSLLDQAFKGEL